ARVLDRVERDGAFADILLEAEEGMAPRDHALATEIVLGTLRWQRRLDAALQRHSRRALRSLDQRGPTALRNTAYQILFLSRVPAFAAVQEGVSLASARPAVRGFVNAVLRALLRAGPKESAAPELDPLEALAIECSFPTWVARRWAERFGRDEAR